MSLPLLRVENGACSTRQYTTGAVYRTWILLIMILPRGAIACHCNASFRRPRCLTDEPLPSEHYFA